MIAVVFCMAARAVAPERKMLEQNKMWIYAYHHFEENETGYNESTWSAYYQLRGDTVIEERQYMKMYRWDDRDFNKSAHGDRHDVMVSA